MISTVDMLHCSEDTLEIVSPKSLKPLLTNLSAKHDEVVRAVSDLHIINDDRVLSNLLLIEDKYQALSSYFSFQDDIKPYMRKIVTNWMLEVCMEQSRDEDVFLLSVRYLDHFLSLVRINRTQLQLVATVCMFLASKMREPHPFDAQILAAYTDSSVTIQEILDWEYHVLYILKWETCLVVPNDFFEHLMHRLPIRRNEKPTIVHHSQTFADLCATEHCFITYPPSVIAASCICVSISGLKGQMWIEENSIYAHIKSITSIEADYIKACQKKIEELELLSLSVNENNNNTLIVNHNVQSKEERMATTPSDVSDIVILN